MTEPRYEKTFCICENKDADQLRSICAGDQRICFRYTDSTIPLLPKAEISILHYARTKTQISCAVSAQVISAFVFAILIVQFLYYLKPKFQFSSHLLWLYSPVCVGPDRKPRSPVFLRRGPCRILCTLPKQGLLPAKWCHLS